MTLIKNKIGIIAGSFDLIHPGYILLFKYMNRYCKKIILALHENPKIERKNKLKIVHTLNERVLILKSIKYIDTIITYKTENDLYKILKKKKFDLRFLDEKYKEKKFTGSDLDIKIRWVPRKHSYSTSKLKRKIYNSFQ